MQSMQFNHGIIILSSQILEQTGRAKQLTQFVMFEWLKSLWVALWKEAAPTVWKRLLWNISKVSKYFKTKTKKNTFDWNNSVMAETLLTVERRRRGKQQHTTWRAGGLGWRRRPWTTTSLFKSVWGPLLFDPHPSLFLSPCYCNVFKINAQNKIKKKQTEAEAHINPFVHLTSQCANQCLRGWKNN